VVASRECARKKLKNKQNKDSNKPLENKVENKKHKVMVDAEKITRKTKIKDGSLYVKTLPSAVCTDRRFSERRRNVGHFRVRQCCNVTGKVLSLSIRTQGGPLRSAETAIPANRNMHHMPYHTGLALIFDEKLTVRTRVGNLAAKL